MDTAVEDAAEVTRLVNAARLVHVAYRPRMDADVVRVPLRDTRQHLENAVPVRAWMQYRGQWCKPGWYLFSRLGVHVSYESRFEMHHLLLLDFASDAVRVIPQPFRLHWRLDRAARRHTPDFLVWRDNGEGVVLDVKGTARAARPGNALVFGVTARACEQMGLRYRVASDIDPVLLRNIEWLAGFQATPFDAAGVADAARALVAEPLTLDAVVGALRADLGLPAATVLPVVFHLLWRRELSVNLSVPMSGQAVLGGAGIIPLPAGVAS